jgi:hypothetical protein
MIALFATPGMALASMVIIVLELLSVAILCVGLLSYRIILQSHHGFHISLHHAGKRAHWGSFGLLAWLYIVSTVFLITLTSVIFVWQPRFF